MASEIKVDTISEKTSANGVTIDGVNIKDSKITTANSVDSDQYVDGSIDAVHLSANSVDSDAYVDGSIDAVHMSANSIDSDSYVDLSIDTAHIGATQVTGAKLNTDVISAQTALTAEPADTDEFMVSDAGVLKRIDYSLIKGGGKINQIVGQYGVCGSVAIGSSSYTSLVDGSGNYLEKEITPSATNSNVLVIVTVQGSMGGSEGFGIQILFDTAGAGNRGGSQMAVSTGDRNMDSQNSNPVSAVYTGTFLHNPNTTNETNYHVKVATVSAASVEFNNAGKACITLMEVLA